MIFENALPGLQKLLQDNGYSYATSSWVEATARQYYARELKSGKLKNLIEAYITDNLVEPPTPIMFRIAIMAYTAGYLYKDLVYMERFPNKDSKDYRARKAHSQLTFANALIQWKLLCEQLGLDWEEMLKLGEEHLKERYADFQKDGWVGL